MPESTIFTKLNLKEQTEIVILNAPPSFESEIEKLRNVTVHRKLPTPDPIAFALSFVTRQSEVDSTATSLAGLMEGDTLVWFAYPKGTSKRYTCDFNRDTGNLIADTLSENPRVGGSIQTPHRIQPLFSLLKPGLLLLNG